MTDDVVGPREAAKRMLVSEATILRLIRSGQLKAVRMGRQWRIAVDDLRRGSSQKQIDTTRQ